MPQPSIKKNYIYRLFYEVLAIVVPFITAPYVARVLGADGVGIYSFTSSVVAYFTMFAALGTASYGAREIAQHRDNPEQSSKLFWEIELMTVGTSLVSLAVWVLVIIFSAEYRWYFVALIPMIFATMFDISWYFTGHERIKYIVIRNSACKIIGVILLFAFIHKKEDLLLYVVINSLIQLAGNLSMWTYLPKMLVRVDFRTLKFRRHLRETLIYFIPTIATSVYTVLDKTLIGVITHDTYQNGYYEQANKIISIVKTMVFVAINSVMGARISYLFSEEKYEEIHNKISKAMNFILLLGIGCVFGLLGVAKQFVPLFFGSGYDEVVPLLCVMSPLIVIIGISNCLGSQYYTPSGKRAQSAKFIIAGSVVNLCLNLIFIPFFQAMGAVVASIAAETVITVLYVKFSCGYMPVSLLFKLIWKRLVAGVVMFACVFSIGFILNISAVLIVIIQVVSGACIYGIILMVLRDDLLNELIQTAFKAVTKRR